MDRARGEGVKPGCERLDSGSWTERQRTMCLIPDSGDPPHHPQHHDHPRYDGHRREDEGYSRGGSSEEVGGIPAGGVGAEHKRYERGEAIFPDGVAIPEEQGGAMDEQWGSVGVKVLSPKFGHASAEGKYNMRPWSGLDWCNCGRSISVVKKKGNNAGLGYCTRKPLYPCISSFLKGSGVKKVEE